MTQNKTQKVCPCCEAKIIDHIKEYSLYPSVTSKLEKKHRYNFRKNVKLKYLTKYIVDMTMGIEFTHISVGHPHWKCEHFGENNFNENRQIKQKYYRKIIQSFFVAEIFNTITNKKNKDLLSLLRTEPDVMDMIIWKLYELHDDEPITSNWKGFKHYFNKIVNMPFVLYNHGIPIDHYHNLHNKLGNHSEFDALIHGSPMTSHGLMYDSWNEIQTMYANYNANYNEII